MKTGDKMTITSPFHTFKAYTSVTFKTKISTDEYDVLPKLKVFLKSSSAITKEPLIVIEKNWR